MRSGQNEAFVAPPATLAIVPVSGFDGHRVVRARVVAPGRVALLGSDPLDNVVAPRGAEDRP